MNKKRNPYLVPKLRFPDFDTADEWYAYTLGDISERIIKKVGSKRLITLSISAGVGFISQTEKFSRDISGKQYENYIHLRAGDLSYNKGNSKKFPQGCIYELYEYDEAAVPNAFISFRFNEDFITDFFKGYFENNYHGRQLKKFITSGARSDGLLNINPSDFFSIVLPTPKDTAEQQKIADCLTSLDELIAAENKKLEALKAHKKGLMQKLFPAEGKAVPQVRFEGYAGAWSQQKLGEVSVYSNGGSYEKEVKQDGKYELITLKSVDMNGNLISSQRYVDINVPTLNKGTLVMILSEQSPGLLGMTAVIPESDKYVLNQRVAEIAPNAEMNNYFLSMLINKNQKYFSKRGAGTKVQNISKPNVVNFEFFCPTLPEQIAIGAFFRNLDELITAQTEKIETLKLHKKGLMQGLFPSVQEVIE